MWLRRSSPESSASAARPSTVEWMLFGTFICAAAAVRIAAAQGDLWIDEIWSLSFARHMTAPWQAVTAIHHDNNHPLNTMMLWVAIRLWGAHAPAAALRSPSLAAGVGMLVVLFLTERLSGTPQARARGWLSAFIGGISFLAIVYASEARGYAMAAFFGVAAFAIARRWPLDRVGPRLAFASACALGVLSHLTFLYVYVGLLAWTFYRDAYVNGRIRMWVAAHQLPLAAMAGYYVLDASKLIYGEGPPFSASEVVRRALSQAAGGPDVGALVWVAAAATAGVVVRGIWFLASRRDDEALFFTAAIVIAPVAILAIYRARFLEVRYFFVLLPFVWLLTARILAHLMTQRRVARLAAAAGLTLFAAGNVLHTWRFLQDHRGHYRDAVAMMFDATSLPEVTVVSDQDFHNQVLLDYYAEPVAGPKRLHYVPATEWQPDAPEWIVTHAYDYQSALVPPVPRFVDRSGQAYVLARSFLYGGISGCNWYVYRRSR